MAQPSSKQLEVAVEAATAGFGVGNRRLTPACAATRFGATCGALALLVVASACGTSQGGNGGEGAAGAGGAGGARGVGGGGAGVGNDAPLALEELGNEYTRIFCEVFVECEDIGYADLNHCLTDREPAGLADALAAISEGRIAYDPVEMGRCRRTFEEHRCELPFLFAPAVPEVLDTCLLDQGRQGEGEPCRSKVECAAGLYCAKNDYSCPGLCTPYQTEGETCEVGSAFECAPSDNLTITDWFSTDPAIIARREAARSSDLTCDGGVCRTQGTLGDPCELICLEGFCDAETKECTQPGGLDERCTNRFEGCADELYCDLPLGEREGVCRTRGTPGEACEFDRDCQDGLVCFSIDGLNRECRAPGTAGAQCNSHRDCQEGLDCRAGECGSLPGFGEPCGSGLCGEGLTCSENVICAQSKRLGESCNDSDALCSQGLCVAGQCEPRLSEGSPCTENNDCRSRDCIDGECVDGSLCEHWP